MCKRLLVEFCVSTVLEFKGLWGHDSDACGASNILECGKALDEKGLEESWVGHLFIKP